MSTIKVNKIENTSTTAGGVSIDNDGHVTIDGQQLPTAGPLSNRNLIINGAMRVAQRGTSFPAAGGGTYPADRWKLERSTAAVITVSQETDAPTGFKNSIKAEITTSSGTGAANFTQFLYKIEANDISHLEYGTANAKTCTISFWAKHSLTGTYPFSLQNHDGSRVYPATYTINSANTWEYKTITFAGDTGGTWNTDGNGVGLRFNFAWNMGSDFTGGTEGAWAATTSFADLCSTSGPDINGTVGNTVQWAGVQLEVGDLATSFEHRSYGDELARCQRYLQLVNYNAGGSYAINHFAFRDSGNWMVDFKHKVEMRTAPTLEAVGSNGLTGLDNSKFGIFNVSTNSSVQVSGSTGQWNITQATTGRSTLRFTGTSLQGSIGNIAGCDTMLLNTLIFATAEL